ncbi:MAG: cell division topological specificity factor MinE [Anaerolineae bacterium]|nr:cell division topological specificity factor MinE [Anaerolineae bacterium]MEB2288214.1 cell division topological specificity factor MinE [Anaerolineae bacterium]
MTSLFERLKGRREPTSAEIAKERLKLVLVADRSDLAPEKLHEMQSEIIDVIKRYIHIDEMEVQIKFEQRDRKNYLVADIPLQRERAYEALAAAEPAGEGEAEEEGEPPEAAAEPEDEAEVEEQPEEDETEPEKE